MEKGFNNIEELINILDPTKIQCYACKKWFFENSRIVRFQSVFHSIQIN